MSFWTRERLHYVASSTLLGIGVLLVVVGNAKHVRQYGTDSLTETHPAGGIIVESKIDEDSNKGLLVVQFTVDGKVYLVRDVVTPSMTCSKREEFYMSTLPGKTWSTVRYNPQDPSSATLNPPPDNVVFFALVVTGSILALVGLIYLLWALQVWTKVRNLFRLKLKFKKSYKLVGKEDHDD